MPSFAYKARDEQGKAVQGILDAASEQQAMLQIDRLGLCPIEIRPVLSSIKEKIGTAPSLLALRLRKGVSAPELIVMTRQLLTLLHAGVPILSCLEALIAQTDNPVLRSVLGGVQKDVQTGEILSSAFAKYPKIFSTIYVQTVRAGETGGVLPEVLARLADMLERDLDTARAVKAAIRYPIMVVLALVIAFLVLITFVIPRFASLYARYNTALPLPTRILIGAHEWIVNGWYITLPAVALLFFAVRGLIQTPRGRYLWDKGLLKIPVFGTLILKFSMARFAQMFGTLYKSGVPVLRVIEIVSGAVGNSAIGKDVAQMAQSVKQGKGLCEPLKKSAYFPPLVTQMVSIGEKSGSLDQMLSEVAHHYDMETKYIVRNLTALIEPMLIVGLGGIVLLFALGIFLPMWSMIKLYR